MSAATSKPLSLNFDEEDIERLAKISGEDIVFDTEEIGPEEALAYLRTHKDPKISEKDYDPSKPVPVSVRKLAEVMKAGAWFNNGYAILLDQDGRLLDGVERLRAVIYSGVTIEAFVARNIQEDVLHTVDQHKKRNYAGTLNIRGFNHANVLHRTMTALIRIENGLLGRDQGEIDISQYDRVLKHNPELIEAVAMSEGSKASALHSTARPILIFMALKAGKRDQLRFFLTGLKETETYGMGNPARTLTNQLKSDRARYRAALKAGKDASKIDWQTVLAISIMAFNDFIKGVTRGEDYLWEPDLGDAALTTKERKEGLTYQSLEVKKRIKDYAPDNLGLPVLEGYPGLKNGKVKEGTDIKVGDFSGTTADELKAAGEKSKGKARAEMRFVTPEIARKYLMFNRNNRALDDRHKLAMADDMRKGYWALNAQPVCFTSDPDDPDLDENEILLINGQHRLHAIIEADMGVYLPVAMHIPKEASATYDSHRKKTRIKSKDGVNLDSIALRSAARLQWKEDNGINIYGVGVTPTSSEIKETILKHPGLGKAEERAKKMNKVASAGVLAYLIYRIQNDRPDLYEQFLEELDTGEGLEKKNPVIEARTKVVGIRSNDTGVKVKIPRKDVLRLYLDTWEAYKTFKDEKKEDQAQESLL